MNSKKKIVVCLPSYNESKNIENITLKIDKYLQKYDEYELYIVNADNNSEDKTSTIFMNTPTQCKKISLISEEIGKGNNMINFFKWCSENNVDYAVTIDADILSVSQLWIDEYLNALINEKKDYVVPLYERSRYEGSTTNHFALPLVYATTGYYIRQPIAGDFAFNKKFIEIIRKQEINDSIRKYGIDIFMTLTACINKLKVKQVYLDKKIHSPSYNKMENMFLDVLDAGVFTLKKQHIEDIRYSKVTFENNILKLRTFKHEARALELLEKYKLDNSNIEELWIECMQNLINNIHEIDKESYEEIRRIFINRAIKFWLSAKNKSAVKCEKEILNQTKVIKKGVMINEKNHSK